MKRRLLLSLAALILSSGLSQAAFADPVNTFTLTLSKANQTASPGAALGYLATITNTSASTVGLDGIEFTTTGFSFIDNNPSCTGNMPCIDENPFIFNAPFTLSSGASYSSVFFNVTVPLAAAITSSSGFVVITGDTGGNNPQTLTSNAVGFSTTVTPEPSSWLLMVTGLAGLAIAYRFRSQTASAKISF